MIEQTNMDAEFLSRLRDALSQSGSITEAADILGENHNTVRSRIRNLGYRVDRQLCLIPIHAPEITDDQAA